MEREEPLGRCVRDDARCTARAYRREVLPDFPCSHGAAQKLHVFTGVNPYRDLQRWVSNELQLIVHRPREFDELGQRPAHGTEVAGWVGEAWNGAETESRNTPWGVFPLTGDRHRSFSASLRNSSGTEREIPSATDAYPIASHPKRSRILSTAQSATQRAMPFLVPGRRASSLSPSGSSSCPSQCSSRCDTEIARSEMVFSSGGSARTARTSSSAISARIPVADIGASSVTD